MQVHNHEIVASPEGLSNVAEHTRRTLSCSNKTKDFQHAENVLKDERNRLLAGCANSTSAAVISSRNLSRLPPNTCASSGAGQVTFSLIWAAWYLCCASRCRHPPLARRCLSIILHRLCASNPMQNLVPRLAFLSGGLRQLHSIHRH